jgi:ArsR family transcriptional regulator
MRSADPDVMLLAALADPVRLSIVRQLAENDGICACDFTECCNVSQPTISHHLKVLHESGLLRREKRGVWVYYQARPEAMQAMMGLFATVGGTTPASAC